MRHEDALLLSNKEMTEKFNFPDERFCDYIRKQVEELGHDFYAEIKAWDEKGYPIKVAVNCVEGEWIIDRSL